MLLLLMLPIFYVVSGINRYLQLCAPSNVLIARVRNSPPRWRTAVLLLALAHALIWAAHLLSMAIEAGSPGWLNLLVLVFAWDAIKFWLLAIHTGIRRMARLVLSPYTRYRRAATASAVLAEH